MVTVRYGSTGMSTRWCEMRFIMLSLEISFAIPAKPVTHLCCRMIASRSSHLGELGTSPPPQSQPLVKSCQFGVSPVNYSDSDTTGAAVVS